MKSIKLAVLLLILLGCNNSNSQQTVIPKEETIKLGLTKIDSIIIHKSLKYKLPYSFKRVSRHNLFLTENELINYDENNKESSIPLNKLKKFNIVNFGSYQQKNNNGYIFSSSNKIIVTDLSLNIVKMLSGSEFIQNSNEYIFTNQHEYDKDSALIKNHLKIYDCLNDYKSYDVTEKEAIICNNNKLELGVFDEEGSVSFINLKNGVQTQKIILKNLPKDDVSCLFLIDDKILIVTIDDKFFVNFNIFSKDGSIENQVKTRVNLKQVDSNIQDFSPSFIGAFTNLFSMEEDSKKLFLALPLKNGSIKLFSFSFNQ